MPFIDTHCHFDFEPFRSTLKKSLAFAYNAGISHIVVPGVNEKNMLSVIKLAQQYPSILYATIGLHPIYTHSPSAIERLTVMLAEYRQQIIAVGEIGLDFYNQTNSPAQQIILLKKQLKLANEHQLPIILHSRKAHAELYRQLTLTTVIKKGVIHSFSGSYEQAMQFVKLGYFIGVGGIITYLRANKTRQAIARLPLEALLLETDAPDMPIYGYQGQANRPERITLIFSALCKLRKESAKKIAQQIYQNSCRLFGLK